MKAIVLLQQVDPQSAAQTVKSFGVEEVIVVQLDGEVKGVLTDYHPDFEHLRVGYPADSTDPYFQYLNPAKKTETGLSIVLSRTAYNRKVHQLYLCESELLNSAKHAVKVLDVEIGWGDKLKPNNMLLTKGFIEKQMNKFPLLQQVEKSES